MTDTTRRPLVTFALFAYNQEQYIRTAVEGALAQTYEPMEIILSDDCSTDQTLEIIQKMVAAYAGPHDLRVRCNKTNMGIAAHVNAVMHCARGEIVLIAAGDDISLPERTAISVEYLKNYPRATAVLLSSEIIDHAGIKIGERILKAEKYPDGQQTLDDLLAWRHVTFGATRALRRDVYNRFGPLKESCPTEDTPLLLRSLLCGTNIISCRKGVRYRRHADNLSSIASIKKMTISEIYKQYEEDTRVALISKTISHVRAEKVLKWTARDMELRQLRLTLAAKNKKKLKATLLAVSHPATSFREKIRLLFAYCSSILRA